MRNGCLFGFLLILLLVGVVDECINKIKENTPEGKQKTAELIEAKRISEQKEADYEKLRSEQLKKEETIRIDQETKIRANEDKNLEIKNCLESLRLLLENNTLNLVFTTDDEVNNKYSDLKYITTNSFITTNGSLTFQYNGYFYFFDKDVGGERRLYSNDAVFTFNVNEIGSIDYGDEKLTINCSDETCITCKKDSDELIYLSNVKLSGSKSIKKKFESHLKKLKKLLVEYRAL